MEQHSNKTGKVVLWFSIGAAVMMMCFLAISVLSLNGSLPTVPEGLSEEAAREALKSVESRMRKDIWKCIVRFDLRGALQAFEDLAQSEPVKMQAVPIPHDPNPVQVVFFLGHNSDATNGIGYATRLIDGNWTTAYTIQGRWAAPPSSTTNQKANSDDNNTSARSQE